MNYYGYLDGNVNYVNYGNSFDGFLHTYSSGTTVLIDFEYAGKNYAAFDVSCFFTEFAGM